MSVRRLLTLSLLVMGLLTVPVPVSAGPRTDAAFVRATNADRREHGLKAMKTSRMLAKLARSHSVAMARKSARRYGAAATPAPCGTTTSPRPPTAGCGWARTSAAAPPGRTWPPRRGGSRTPS